jgi:hypothetical protein
VTGRRVSDLHAGQRRKHRGLVDEHAVGVEDRHLLERHHVCVEPGDDRADPLEAVAPHVPPPGRRERLAGPDPGPDVVGGDGERRRDHRRPVT